MPAAKKQAVSSYKKGILGPSGTGQVTSNCDLTEKGLKMNAKDQQVAHQREVGELRAKVGELVLELDARKKLEALLELEETPC